MTSPAWELQRAIHARLVADAPLAALLGGARVFDDVPRGTPFPYVTFAASEARDWSTGTEDGAEHAITLHVWSRANGEREVHLILAALHALLHEAPLTLTGHRLVNLRHEFSDARRDADGETYRGLLRLRAVTEPAP